MGLLYWVIIGIAAGSLAKMVTPQTEKGGWISSLIIGILGAMLGGFIANVLGVGGFIASMPWLGGLIIATGGAILVLYIYYKWLKDKLNLPL
ncbi:MAG: GlsB/YeaQ/YmgE family stress response membrane protein [Bacteroidota bacterium]